MDGRRDVALDHHWRARGRPAGRFNQQGIKEVIVISSI
jgi:hypothetical protein